MYGSPYSLGGHAQGRRALSLLEVLVVVAIIMILSALVIPTVNRLSASAKSTHCVNNLRQWGILFSTFISENNGFFPDSEPILPPPYGWQVSWQHPMYSLNTPVSGDLPYRDWNLGKGILGCPAHINTPYAGTMTLRYYSYLYNYDIGKPSPQNYGDPWPGSLNIHRIENLSDLAVLVDARNQGSPETGFDYGKRDRVGFNHAGRCNILYADWHVGSSALPMEQKNATPILRQ